MKSRLNLIAAALVVLLGSMVWVVQDRSPVTPVAGLHLAAAPTNVQTDLPMVTPAAAPVVARVVEPAPAFAAPAAVVAAVETPASPARTKSAPTVSVDASGDVTYVARGGDTVSELATALHGTDSKAHRDAVVSANESLQSNPDRVLTGQRYSLNPAEVPVVGDIDDQSRDAAPAAALVAPKVTPTVDPTADGPNLRYTAQTGDTVRGLAADFLGGDTQRNRDAIVEDNASLQQNPDHLVAGKSYTIEVPNGLSADPNAPRAAAPTTQPGADEVARLSGGRSLRYTARAGDTVTKLALTLLGSDTAANRDLIIQCNPSLKSNPDQVTAGQTYWIPAPTADSTK